MQLHLQGKAALVTGVSAGLGAAIALGLAQEGVRLAITARRRDRLAAQVDGLRAAGAPEVVVLPADMTDRNAVRALAADATDQLGAIDILVNCAGASRPIPLATDDDAIWDDSYALNFDCIRILTHHLVTGMQARGWGRVLNVSGNVEVRSLNAAAVAKAGLHIWAKALASLVAKDGVTVNTLVPGRIWSEQIRERLHPDDTERATFIAGNIPIGRFGEPEEFADVAVFLASDRAAYVTGTVIAIDGGMRRSPH